VDNRITNKQHSKGEEAYVEQYVRLRHDTEGLDEYNERVGPIGVCIYIYIYIYIVNRTRTKRRKWILNNFKWTATLLVFNFNFKPCN
jgi:hypothetical protein